MDCDIDEATQAVLRFLYYLGGIVCDTYNYIRFALNNLIIAWYPLAVLTLVPVFWTRIPPNLAVAYLAAYCAAAGWVCVTEPRQKKKLMECEISPTKFMRNIKIDT